MSVLGRWFKRRVQLAAVRGGTEDLERFVTSLRGQSDDELGVLVGLATLLRINLRNMHILPEESLDIGTPLSAEEQSEIQLKIGNLVRDFQESGNPIDAAGTMVWLHTLRAFRYPELRVLGRAMWGELRRGFDHANDGLDQIGSTSGKEIPDEARRTCAFVPNGLEPRDT